MCDRAGETDHKLNRFDLISGELEDIEGERARKEGGGRKRDIKSGRKVGAKETQ